MRILGGAGTGKTFIAMKKAARDMHAGKDVLFLCCNKELCEFVREQLGENAHLDFRTFEELMRETIGDDYETAPVNENGNKNCFDLVDGGSPKKYDSIIVDEGQDFDADMGLTVRLFLSDLKRGYVGARWNHKYLRALQRMLIPTQGKGVSSRSFFEADFGTSKEEFVMYLAMPEEHLGWRGHFARRKNETDEEMAARETVWIENQEILAEWKRRFQALGDTKDEFVGFIGDNNYSIERFLEIKNIEQKKLFIHYFTMPTLLKALSLENAEEKAVIVNYITEDFPLLYKRMIKYVAEGRLPHSMLEGALLTFKADFVRSVLEIIDYEAEEEPFVVNNLLKAQKRVGRDYFGFDLIRTYYLFKNIGALRKVDKVEAIEAIRSLDERKTRSILAARFKTFKVKLIKQATDGELGVQYVTSQIDQQLNNFCKQISLFEDFE